MNFVAHFVIASACVGCLFPDVSGLNRVDASSEASVDASSTPCSDPAVLVGSSDTSGTTDTTPIPYLDSYVASVNADEHVACAWIYLTDTPPPSIALGVYSDTDAGPNALLSSGAITKPVVGWNSAPLKTPIDLTKGSSVWIGWAVPSGAATITLHQSTGCARGLRSDDLIDGGALPTSFDVTGSNNSACVPAAYLGD